MLTASQLPSAGGQFWTLTHKEARDPAQGKWSNVEPFIHIIKLDQINSRIQKTVFRVDKDILNGTPEQRAKLDRKMATIRGDLDKWIQTCPQTPKAGNKITWMYDPESAYLDARDFYGVYVYFRTKGDAVSDFITGNITKLFCFCSRSSCQLWKHPTHAS